MALLSLLPRQQPSGIVHTAQVQACSDLCSRRGAEVRINNRPVRANDL